MDDEHFLSRLDRLDALEVEDALALYYDPALVRQLLAHAPERGHGERVAISMDDPREGPFIVVTQTGDFVTALARGMSVGSLPVVPRAVWHAARRDQELAREMFAKAAELSRGKTRSLRRELFGLGPWVSREVMNVMVSLGKLHPGPFLRAWMGSCVELSEALSVVRTRERWQRTDREFFANAGRTLWLASHFSVVVGGSRVKELSDDDPLRQQLGELSPSLYFSRLGIMGPLVRALWLCGKLGPIYFGGLKQRLRTAPGPEYAMDAAMGLAVIGHRFSKYRGEARKALDFADAADAGYAEHARRAWAAVGWVALDLSREKLRESLIEYGRSRWANVRAAAPGSPLYFARPEDVPDELALPMLAASRVDLWSLDEQRRGEVAAVLLSASCLVEAEDCYLPKRWADQMPPFDFGLGLELAFERQRAGRTAAPVKVGPKVGRNEMCSCGSGKKWKRCCGAA
jgi:hypothetical protein